MFESELRKEKKDYQEMQREIDRFIRSYEEHIRMMISEFSKVNGKVEKQIEDQLSDLEKNINNLEKEFKKAIDKQKKSYLEMLDDELTYALDALERKSSSLLKEYKSVVSSCFMYKGEL